MRNPRCRLAHFVSNFRESGLNLVRHRTYFHVDQRIYNLFENLTQPELSRKIESLGRPQGFVIKELTVNLLQ